jgi:glycosyltransferase involved in cell wall biosynthesis
VIPSGVDCERFRPPSPSERAAARSALALGENEVAIGTVGALEVRKGHRCLIEAIASPVLRASRDAEPKSGVAIQCFIAGEGSQRATLSTDIDRRGLAASVRLIGAIDDPRKLLWALDIFAFPSLHEGLGVALIEAMACGLPAVASATGGIGDLIESGRTGILVAPDDPAQLAQALVRLAAQPGTRETLGVAARARVLEKFSIAAMARGTLELYRLCLARGAKIQGEAAQRCGA